MGKKIMYHRIIYLPLVVSKLIALAYHVYSHDAVRINLIRHCTDVHVLHYNNGIGTIKFSAIPCKLIKEYKYKKQLKLKK